MEVKPYVLDRYLAGGNYQSGANSNPFKNDRTSESTFASRNFFANPRSGPNATEAGIERAEILSGA